MSNNKTAYNYGKCHVCGEQMKERQVDFWLLLSAFCLLHSYHSQLVT